MFAKCSYNEEEIVTQMFKVCLWCLSLAGVCRCCGELLGVEVWGVWAQVMVPHHTRSSRFHSAAGLLLLLGLAAHIRGDSEYLKLPHNTTDTQAWQPRPSPVHKQIRLVVCVSMERALVCVSVLKNDNLLLLAKQTQITALVFEQCVLSQQRCGNPFTTHADTHCLVWKCVQQSMRTWGCKTEMGCKRKFLLTCLQPG